MSKQKKWIKYLMLLALQKNFVVVFLSFGKAVLKRLTWIKVKEIFTLKSGFIINVYLKQLTLY